MLNSCRHLHILEAYYEGVLLSWAETTRGLLLTRAKMGITFVLLHRAHSQDTKLGGGAVK